MNTNEFFEAVNNLQINDLDMYNHAQEITDNFEPEKLQMLCDDFDEYLCRIIELSEIEIQPYQSILVQDYFDMPNQKLILKEKLENGSIDFDEFWDGYTYPKKIYFLEKLRNLLISLKIKHKQKAQSKPVKNLSVSDESLSQTNKGINFTVLDRIVYLTDYWRHGDESVFDKILNRSTTDFLNLYKQFEKELERNIVLSESESSLKRLIKHYLFELNELFSGDDIKTIIYPWSDVPNTHKEKFRQYQFKKENEEEYTKANKFENYCYAKIDLLSLILEQLEINILKTGLSLNDLFKEMEVSYPVYDEFTKYFDLFDFVRDDLSKKQNEKSNQHINWLKPESLSRFIDALKDQNLIESRETAEIIEQHFKPQTEPQKEPEPIEWVYPQKNLLAYLIRQLKNNRLIDCKNIWQETEPHFSINGEPVNNLRQSEDGYENRSKRGMPKNHELIDNIIQSLSDSH